MSPQRNIFVVAIVLVVSVPNTFGKGKKIECRSSVLPAPGYFIDPTATKRGNVDIRSHVYVAPFAVLEAGRYNILVDEDSDVQDSAHVDSSGGPLVIGKKAILAHGAMVKSNPNPKIPEFHPAIGIGGTCPGAAPSGVCPSFVGFNAEVDGGIVQLDAMVGALARIGPGVTIPSGRKVKPGKNVTSDADVMALTDPVTNDDRDFMNGVIDVNVALAKGYAELSNADSTQVEGINCNPPTSFASSVVPVLDGQGERQVPSFLDRIIGHVQTGDTLESLERVMTEKGISIRGDEGFPLEIGSITKISNGTTVHALKGTSVVLGPEGTYGAYSIVHGGTHRTTTTGRNFSIGERAVFYDSAAPANCTIPARTLIYDSNLTADDCRKISGHEVWEKGKFLWKVDW
jgi:carbonic anhydrase/acetyltransferase-like protein (isoleucine patch superfamily)